MNITPLEMYFLIKLNSIGAIFIIFGIFFAVSGITSISFCYSGWLVDKPLFKKITILGCFLFITGLMIPSTKEMAAILVLPKIINNEQVQTIPDKLLNLGIEWLEELKPKKE